MFFFSLALDRILSAPELSSVRDLIKGASE